MYCIKAKQSLNEHYIKINFERFTFTEYLTIILVYTLYAIIQLQTIEKIKKG